MTFFLMFIVPVLVILIVNILFFIGSNKFKTDYLESSSFECGYTSYFFSHFSFSVHYFIISMVFLFLDLELCFIMPFFNDSLASFNLENFLMIFVWALLMGLLIEWKEGKLDWFF